MKLLPTGLCYTLATIIVSITHPFQETSEATPIQTPLVQKAVSFPKPVIEDPGRLPEPCPTRPKIVDCSPLNLTHQEVDNYIKARQITVIDKNEIFKEIETKYVKVISDMNEALYKLEEIRNPSKWIIVRAFVLPFNIPQKIIQYSEEFHIAKLAFEKLERDIQGTLYPVLIVDNERWDGILDFNWLHVGDPLLNLENINRIDTKPGTPN